MSTTQPLELSPLVRNQTSSNSSEYPGIITGGHWAFRGESMWSIFHKLAYLNEFSARDIVRCFGTAAVQTRPLIRVAERDLRIPDGIDVAKLAASVGLTIEEINWSFYEHYTLDPSSRGASVLRYCPKCIKLGVHATLHQSPALVACPWHEVPLVSACPSCGGVQLYELDTALLHHPYTCRCGYQFWPDLGNAPWKKRFEESQERDLEEFVNWIRPVRAARGEHSERYVTLLEDERDHVRLDDVLFELNRIYPGPAWLHRCLGDPLTQDKRDTKRFVSTKRREVLATREVSRNDMRLNIESMLENPNDTYFVANVLEPARATLQSLKRQVRRMFFAHHAQCADEIIFVNDQLYTANRTGTACIWASAYAMWDKTTYHLFDKTPVSVPLSDMGTIPADHLGIYLKWQQTLRVFAHYQAKMIDKDILDLLVVAFQRWLRIRIFQNFLDNVGIVNEIINPFRSDALDGELYLTLSTYSPKSYNHGLTIATIDLEPPSIRIDVFCSFNGRAAARAARHACTLKDLSWWTDLYKSKNYTYEFHTPQDRIDVTE
ncbi:MAG: hypothetical protein AB2777_20875 [Candidatus Thiodiazotropha endolucinida]